MTAWRQISRSGFTLIELLCVTAIIALMTSMLMPEIQTVRQKALCTACAANLRQIGVALNLYLADHDYTYPYIQPTQTTSGTDETIEIYANQPDILPRVQTLQQAFSPYGINDKALQCPADMLLGPNSCFKTLGTSYMWSPVVDGDMASSPTLARRGGLRPAKLSKLRQMSDFTSIHKFSPGDSGKQNILYGDGHVATQ